MQSTLVFTFICNDKTGVVEQLSNCVANAGGNWLESRMSKLAGKFAGIVQLTISQDQQEQLIHQLQQLESSGFAITIDQNTSAPTNNFTTYYRLSILGLDRTGIVQEVAHALAQQQLSIVDMHSVIESAAMSGESLFKAELDIVSEQPANIETLEDELEQIAASLDIEWSLKRLQPEA